MLPGEAWSYGRHAAEQILPAAGTHKVLRKTAVMIAHALDLHRTAGGEAVAAFLTQAYKATHAAAAHPGREWAFAWPLSLGVVAWRLPLSPKRPLGRGPIDALLLTVVRGSGISTTQRERSKRLF